MFQLAHFSDPHIAPLPKARPSQLANKRFLGWLSWKRRRQRLHRREILDALAADLRAQAPDHVVVTGDITNIALPEEFRQASAWLGALGAADWISVVPGNHDAYVALPWAQGLGAWADYMSGDGAPADRAAAGGAEAGQGAFPFLRRRGPLAIVGLSTALPTPPGSAAGVLGSGQLERLAASLEALGREGLFRCVLLHHPPQDNGISRRKRLIDAEGFRAVLREVGAELVLHGHDHAFNDARLPGPRGPVPVFGVPSASASLGQRRRPGAHYQIYGIERAGAAWRIRVLTRGLGPDGASFVEAASRSVEVPA